MRFSYISRYEIYSVYLEIYEYGKVVQGVRFPDASHAEPRPTGTTVTSGTDCPGRPGERRPMPLTGRTTVTPGPDLKGCLEEVSQSFTT
jgi:hypothetical protein